MEDTGKIKGADNFLEAVMCRAGDMIEPMDNPCVDCFGLSCYGCPFDDSK